MIYHSKLTLKTLSLNVMMQVLLLFAFFLGFQFGWVEKSLKAFLVLPFICCGGYMWLSSNVIRISSKGISSGVYQFNQLQWACIGTVKWNEVWSAAYMFHSDPIKNSLENKRVCCYFPINNPELFKADILKYAPEGNPLRVWVESGQFRAIHRQD